MRVAIIGRSELLYDTAVRLRDGGHEITCILTAKEAPEYARTAEDFRQLAAKWNVPFAQGARIREHIDFLAAAEANIAVSINYTGIVPQSVIDIFPFGVLNAHGGDLPRYRGNACQAWAIINGEDRIGLCIHRMIGGELDSGDIIARDYLNIDITTNITKVYKWMSSRSPNLMYSALQRLEQEPSFVLEKQSTDPTRALRCYPRRPEDGRINWTRSALHIMRLINASNKPFSGAFCEYGGRNFTIWDAELMENSERFCAVPGQITRVGDGFVEVACGNGKLRIMRAEYEGRVDYPAAWIKSIRERFL